MIYTEKYLILALKNTFNSFEKFLFLIYFKFVFA